MLPGVRVLIYLSCQSVTCTSCTFPLFLLLLFFSISRSLCAVLSVCPVFSDRSKRASASTKGTLDGTSYYYHYFESERTIITRGRRGGTESGINKWLYLQTSVDRRDLFSATGTVAKNPLKLRAFFYFLLRVHYRLEHTRFVIIENDKKHWRHCDERRSAFYKARKIRLAGNEFSS